MRRALAQVVVPAVFAGLLVSGCTTSVRGVASPAAGASSPATATPTEPTETTGPPAPVTPPPPAGAGRVLESHRIAGATALVPLTFPDRTENCSSEPYTATGPLVADWFADDAAADVLEQEGFVAAWALCSRRPDGGAGTSMIVMELSDPDAAARAAEGLATVQSQGGYEPVALPGVDAVAVQLTATDGDDLQAFVPVGRMLAYAYHEADHGKGAEELARLVTEQIRLLQAFQPTPQADVPGLPADPLDLGRVTLDPPGELRDASGPFDLEGYLRLAIDPVRERELLTASGFRGFFTKVSDEGDLSYAVALYTFPTSAETNTVYTAFAQLETATYGGTTFTLPAIPDAPCFSFPQGDRFYQRCYVGYGSYLASIDVLGLARADDVDRMNQLLPAQRDLIDG